MAERTVLPDPDDENILEFFKSLGEGGGRILQGVYSTPWTSIPFTIAILAYMEVKFPGITNKFWAALGQFFSMIGATLGNALAGLGLGVTKSVNDWLKDLGASPAGQPAPPPPPPPGTTHAWFAHTTGVTAFQLNQETASFDTAAKRDQWVKDTNGSILTHLLGNWVNETWDQVLDANGTPIGDRLNDVKLPPPNPWWVVPI